MRSFSIKDKQTQRWVGALCFAVILLLLWILSDWNSWRRPKLVVGTKNSITTYFYDRYDKESGFEYELVKSFADSFEYDLEIKKYQHVEQMLKDLEAGKLDVVAAGVTQTEERKQRFLFGPSYAHTKEFLVCNQTWKKLKKKKTTPRFVVVAASSYLDNLSAVELPKKASWEELPITTDESLDMVEAGEADCTISDEHIYRAYSRVSSRLLSVKQVGERRSLSWMLNKDNSKLRKQMDRWMFDFLSQGNLETLYEKYFGFVDRNFNRFDVRAFQARIQERLLEYFHPIKEAADKYGLPWELIAAISYQESHWDPLAKSPTGVRGFMMLTRETASLMGVNRLDPIQSIDGGVRYLLRVRDSLPSSIQEPDRTWMALAAYNVGIGHVLDIRSLVSQKRGNPDDWKEVKKHLPLLSKEKYYSKLRYGYARGLEPVHYVRRIRTYYEILKKHALAIEEQANR